MLKLLWVLLFGRPCAHAWALVAEKELPPPWTVLTQGGSYRPSESLEWCKRTYFAVIKCDKCGAIKTFEKRA
jgi:hypothetical protein